MKSTVLFKQTIKDYLDERAKTDKLFALNYAKANKSIDECITFIFQEVQKSGCNGFADDEIYGMAMHYYDEDNLGEIKATHCKVVVNHHIELTEEDKEQAKRDAIEKYQQECINKMRAEEKAKADKEKAKAKANKSVEAYSPSLF